MKYKAVITDAGFPNVDIERRILESANCSLEWHQCRNEDEVIQVAGSADIVITQWAPLGARAIASMEKVKGIVRYGIGLDNVDLPSAQNRGIPVRNIPDYCIEEVAEHTCALLLTLQRQIPLISHQIHSGTWSIKPPLPLPPLRSCVLGLVGFGRVAQEVSVRMKGFGVKVIAHDPFAEARVFGDAGVTAVKLTDLLSKSDMVSLHCPLGKSTRHIISSETINLMKKSAFLVNTSRGGLIDTDVLVEALESGRLSGAGLDVFEEEPLPIDHSLRRMKGVVLSSHTAWYSSESIGVLQRRAAEVAVDLLKSQPTDLN